MIFHVIMQYNLFLIYPYGPPKPSSILPYIEFTLAEHLHSGIEVQILQSAREFRVPQGNAVHRRVVRVRFRNVRRVQVAHEQRRFIAHAYRKVMGTFF